MKTSIYVDGFNLYYRAVKGTTYKWLDIKTLCQNSLASHHQVTKIKYFTARASGKKDAGTPVRQQAYLSAIQAHIPELEIFYGAFTTHEVNMLMAKPPASGSKHVRVLKTEEKGSDVNLAVHMINDAWKNQFDCAVIISNDSDLAEPIKLIKQEFPKKIIGVICPCIKRRPSKELNQYATFTKTMSLQKLKNAQMPDQIPNTNIYKPKEWI